MQDLPIRVEPVENAASLPMNENLRALRVTARRAETADIVTFDLAEPSGAELPAFTAGSHIDVEAAPGLVRQYSLLNDPAERHRYRIGVLKDSASRGGSVAMHGIQAGDLVRIAGPRNHFPLHPGTHETLLLAGGIGITPLLCMAQQLHREQRRFILHYCVRSAAHAAYLDDLSRSAFAANVQVHCDDGAESQRLNIAAVLGALAADAHIYVCGPGGFMAWCIDAAAAAGIAETQVHREYFKGTTPAVETGDRAFEVKLASSGAVFNVAADATILSVLRAHGIPMPASCESGVCGTCLTGVVSGVPLHRDLYLTPEERAAGDVILPCCSRASSEMLVLDI